ncbi:MAG: DNA-binding protein WhiA [Candidatus Limnocylindrales bacterium]
MTSAGRDLVTALRAELAGVDPGRPCDRSAERLGLGEAWAGGPTDPAMARLAVRLERKPASAGRDAEPADPAAFDFAASPEHCRMAWLRGRFLARGSLSIAGGRTHLEFVVAPDEAPVLADWLALADLPASWRIRRGRGVVTWKSAEVVGLFLRRIGAGGALLELEARQVSRTLRGELNRVLNAESSNLLRSVAAAGRQLAAIDALEGDGRLAEQPYVVRLVADARRETPEATLADLADRLAIHRSAVQRALDRVERLALVGVSSRD